MPAVDPRKTFVKLVEQNAHRHRTHEVFRDFCEIAALSISNAVDRSQFDAREARYLEIVGRYERAEAYRFREMLGCIVDALSEGLDDVLGQVFMSLNLGDHWRGQFFTPVEICRLMASLTMGRAADQVKRDGFVTISEPAAGAGAMIIAAAGALQDQGINYQQALHATTTDIDPIAVHMAYVQFSLLHIPAIVIHGDALCPDKTRSHWVTPAHVLGRWDQRLQRRASMARDLARSLEATFILDEAPPEAPEAPPVQAQRDTIVTQRLADADQLSLFS